MKSFFIVSFILICDDENKYLNSNYINQLLEKINIIIKGNNILDELLILTLFLFRIIIFKINKDIFDETFDKLCSPLSFLLFTIFSKKKYINKKSKIV